MRFVRQALQISRDRAKGKSPVSFPCDGHKCRHGGTKGQEKAVAFSEIDINIKKYSTVKTILRFFPPEPQSFEFVDYRTHCLQVDCT